MAASVTRSLNCRKFGGAVSLNQAQYPINGRESIASMARRGASILQRELFEALLAQTQASLPSQMVAQISQQTDVMKGTS